MSDLLKSAIEHLGWPVATLIICVVFQKQLNALFQVLIDLLKRVNQLSVKHKETSLEATVEAKSQSIEVAADSDAGLGSVTTLATQEKPVVADDYVERAYVQTFGGDLVSTPWRMQLVKTDLERLQYPLNETDTTELLIRQLAVQQVYTYFEKTYRLIFGSQIKALEFLHVHGLQLSIVVRIFYDEAAAANVAFYSDYAFEDWCQFISRQGLIEIDSEQDLISITPFGRDFLVWMLGQRLSRERSG